MSSAVSRLLLLFQHGVDLAADTFRSHTQVGFEDFDRCSYETVRPAVQYDVYRRTVFIVRHIFDRADLRMHLVTMTTCHLVTRLDTAFNRQIYL